MKDPEDRLSEEWSKHTSLTILTIQQMFVNNRQDGLTTDGKQEPTVCSSVLVVVPEKFPTNVFV